MTDINVSALEKSIHKTNIWLKQIEEGLRLKGRDDAYALLRGVLHLIRDRIPKEEATAFAAQLPILLKGVYYDGWVLNKEIETPRNEEDFVEAFKQKIGREVEVSLPYALESILMVIATNIDLCEYQKFYNLLPKAIRKFIPIQL